MKSNSFKMNVEIVLRHAALLAIILLGSMKAVAQEWDHEYFPFVEEGKVWNCWTDSPSGADLSTRASAQGESTHDMLEEGKSWIYEYHHYEYTDIEGNPYTEEYYPVRYTLIGDTVIDSKSYYKMYREDNNVKSYYAAYREEGLKVYVIYPSVNEEWLIIDFENEGLYPPDGNGVEKYAKLKDHIDYVEVDGIQYRRHTYYENEEDKKRAIGVEGVGFFFYGLGFPSILGPVLDCMCDYEVFDFCEVNGKNIFGYYDFLKEGVATSISSIGEKTDPSNPIYYDLQGRRLSATPQKGIYIQNGKKKLVK